MAFALGIVASDLAWRSPHCWLITFSVTAAAAMIFFRRSPQFAYPLFLLAVFALGGFYLQAYDAAQTTPPSARPSGPVRGRR